MNEHLATSTVPEKVVLFEPTCSISMSRSEWIGDKQNGVELRYAAGGLDEVCLYANGVCVMHMEVMNDVGIWFGLHPRDGVMVHLNIFSKNCRSHITAKAGRG